MNWGTVIEKYGYSGTLNISYLDACWYGIPLRNFVSLDFISVYDFEQKVHDSKGSYVLANFEHIFDCSISNI